MVVVGLRPLNSRPAFAALAVSYLMSSRRSKFKVTCRLVGHCGPSMLDVIQGQPQIHCTTCCIDWRVFTGCGLTR